MRRNYQEEEREREEAKRREKVKWNDLLSFVWSNEDIPHSLMKLVTGGLACEGVSSLVWDHWVSQNAKYKVMEGFASSLWKAAHENQRNLENYFTGFDVLKLAMDHGYIVDYEDPPFRWAETIQDEFNMQRRFGYMSYFDYTMDKQKEDMIHFLQTVFEEHERIAYQVIYEKAEFGGEVDRRVQQYMVHVRDFIEQIRQTRYWDELFPRPNDLKEFTFKGVHIQFNPIKEDAKKPQEVSCYRYALVEQATRYPYHSIQAFEALEIPFTVLVDGGDNYMLQALVRVDAQTIEEYQERLEYIYATLKRANIMADHSHRHPSSSIRLPGIPWGNVLHRLLATHMGCRDFARWQQKTRMVGTGYEEIEVVSDHVDKEYTDDAYFIEGVLGQGGKMIVTGPPKSYKTFMLFDLAIALNWGQQWFGYQCRKSKVLYLNFELRKGDCYKRLQAIMKARGLQPADLSNFEIWHNIDQPRPMRDLARTLVDRVRNNGYEVIIVDPVYCVMDGDESSASSVKDLLDAFSYLIRYMNTAVIFCHHHNKSSKQQTDVVDRSSGSSLFGRFPSAMVDIEMLDFSKYEDELLEMGYNPDKTRAAKIELALRNYELADKIYAWFQYPQYVIDETGFLRGVYKGKKIKKDDNGKPELNKAQQAEMNQQKLELLIKTEYIEKQINGMHVDTIRKSIPVTPKTIRNYVNASDSLAHKNNIVYLAAYPMTEGVGKPNSQEETAKDDAKKGTVEADTAYTEVGTHMETTDTAETDDKSLKIAAAAATPSETHQ